jgi:hypothetical protein
MKVHEFPPGFPEEMIELARKMQEEENIRRGEDGRHYNDFETFMPPGTPAPGFSLQTLDGETVTLADYAGQYLVVEVGSFT